MKEKKAKKSEEHFANDDPTEFPHDHMEDMAKQAMKKFKSLNSQTDKAQTNFKKDFKTNHQSNIMKQQTQTRRIKILVAKLGLDGHDRGALVLCRAFRDAGMEVIYSGLFATPDRIAQIVEDEDVDAVALSLLNGAHGTLFPRVAQQLKKRKIKDVLIVGGGVIPDEDKKILERSGVTGNFGPGTSLDLIIDHITNGVSKLRKL